MHVIRWRPVHCYIDEILALALAARGEAFMTIVGRPCLRKLLIPQRLFQRFWSFVNNLVPIWPLGCVGW